VRHDLPANEWRGTNNIRKKKKKTRKNRAENPKNIGGNYVVTEQIYSFVVGICSHFVDKKHEIVDNLLKLWIKYKCKNWKSGFFEKLCITSE
jgi:hypothetical protein